MAEMNRGLASFDDTCDACSAAISYLTVMVAPDKTVELCAHDFRKHEAHILAKGYLVEDRRHLINEKPSVSASNQEA